MVGDIVAIADRMDTLVGIFGIGKMPTGDKDPFALRRAALGVIHIIQGQQYTVSLDRLIEIAVSAYQDVLEDAHAVKAPLKTFMIERFKADQTVPVNLVKAVLACQQDDLVDVARRIKASQSFMVLPEAQALITANKRVHQILKKQDGVSTTLDQSLFEAEQELALHTAMSAIQTEVQTACQAFEYERAMALLSQLQQPIDAFFDQVMVMADDQALRDNRLALLAHLRALFLSVLDVAQL
jgi:glycyl-tRNA synthetase beta chain